MWRDNKKSTPQLPFNWQFSVLASVLFSIFPVYAELHFNIDSLKLSKEQKEQIDLSGLTRVDTQMPGEYDVRILVNTKNFGHHKLYFVACGNNLCPQLTKTQLSEWGVKVDNIAGLSVWPDTIPPEKLKELIPGYRDDFDFEKSELTIGIPQALINNQARGYIPPSQWENGLPMLFSSYSLSGSEIKHRSAATGYNSVQYLNLRNGANLGPWRLRNYSYLSRDSVSGTTWNSMQTWIERDLNHLHSRIRIGEASTAGIAFDSFNFRGVSLSSQDEMRPDSQRGYAPVIRGIALSNAIVEIRQNGNLLYQTSVSAGSFVIDDLYATSTSGDLQVLIHEEDGTVREFTQAFASPPIAIRQGITKYSASVGEYGYHSNHSAIKKQNFVQAEILHGLLSNTSLYSGVLLAEEYRAGTIGVGQGLGTLGAVSMDVTHAETQRSNSSPQKGESYRIRYSKNFDTTATNLTVAGYRYSTEGYYSFDEASQDYYAGSSRYTSQLKSQAQVSLSQNIGPMGAVVVSAYQQQYRGNQYSTSRSFAGSWNKAFNGVTLGVNQTQSRHRRTGTIENITSASISLPLGKWLAAPGSSLRMSNRLSRSNLGVSSMTSTVTGSALEDNRLSYSLAQSRSRGAGGSVSDGSALSMTWQGSQASFNAGYANYYGQNERISWGARGAVVVHPYGVTLAQQLPESSSYALIRAPGAEKVKVRNRSGVVTNRHGYAIVPSLTPYRDNDIYLDTVTLPEDVDLLSPATNAIPVKEALVLADYQTLIGYRVFLTLKHNGHPLPFGVTVSAGESAGITDEQGQVFISGVPEKVMLQAALPGGMSCTTEFNAENQKVRKSNGLLLATLECQ